LVKNAELLKLECEVWFWQDIISPHMAGLANALARKGVKVVYVAEQNITDDRLDQGWNCPDLNGVEFKLCHNKDVAKLLSNNCNKNSIHICQGVRANRSIGVAQKILKKRKINQWVVMETVDSKSYPLLKKVVYSFYFYYYKNDISRILAIGYKTSDWIISCGFDRNKVFEFAYFLPKPNNVGTSLLKYTKKFRFVYVGRLIKLKNVDLLIKAFSIINSLNCELVIVGSGPNEKHLQSIAKSIDNVQWLGKVNMKDVSKVMSMADCLVLPSRYDGWGAVISESLIAGTPVICSNLCGAAGVVNESNVGGVFLSGKVESLTNVMKKEVGKGKNTKENRVQLEEWSKSLTIESGSEYLLSLILNKELNAGDVNPPWA
jgi:glycosyltransferase involved in cell wall biosynthesis